MTHIGDITPSLPERAATRVGKPGGWKAPTAEEVEEQKRTNDAKHRAYLARLNGERFERERPGRFADVDLDKVSLHDRDVLAEWADAPAGRNVLMSGTVGCGKTYAALAAVRRWSSRDDVACEMHITTAVELLDSLRPGYVQPGFGGEMGSGPDPYRRAVTTGILVLDDVGAERPTDWTSERMAAVVDRRWLDELPIVATTNLTLGPKGELVEAIGERTYSRLVGSGAVVLRMNGADRRRS